jgi:hypothetical protein
VQSSSHLHLAALARTAAEAQLRNMSVVRIPDSFGLSVGDPTRRAAYDLKMENNTP